MQHAGSKESQPTIIFMLEPKRKLEAMHVHDDPLSTISAIRPNVMQGHQHVRQPASLAKKMING
jgi:hypothetical protein